MSSQERSRPRRRDAQRNREFILRAAGGLLAERGLGVGHYDIAQAAEVGVGTVYRHFPEQRQLIEALFAGHIEAVASHAEQALSPGTGWEGLREFMTSHLEMQQSNRGLRELLRHANTHPDLARAAQERIAPVVAELVRRAHEEGALAPEVDTGDFVLVRLMICGVMDAAEPHEPELWRRALDFALDGMRAARPLSGNPPTGELIGLIEASAPPVERRSGRDSDAPGEHAEGDVDQPGQGAV